MAILKSLFRQFRKSPSELAAALSTFAPGELIRLLVDLLTTGELRLVPRPRKRKPRRTLCAKFAIYHARNPRVGDWFLQAARALKAEQHRERYAVAALTERIRWDIRLGVIKTDDFKISNDLRACYARLVLMRDPSLCGLFTLKPSAADDLVVDGLAWRDFAKAHELELWPERAARKKEMGRVGLPSSKFKERA